MDRYDPHNLRVIEVANKTEAQRAIKEIGAGSGGNALMVPKAVHRLLRVENLSIKAAIILKQEMLSRGGEAALNWEVGALSVDDDRCPVDGYPEAV